MNESEPRLEPLSELLEHAIDSQYGLIYLQGDCPWRADSLGLIYFTDIYESHRLEDTHPDFMRQHNLQYVMQVPRAQDAIVNAYLQKEEVSTEELVACFNYHYLHSGFLTLT